MLGGNIHCVVVVHGDAVTTTGCSSSANVADLIGQQLDISTRCGGGGRVIFWRLEGRRGIVVGVLLTIWYKSDRAWDRKHTPWRHLTTNWSSKWTRKKKRILLLIFGKLTSANWPRTTLIRESLSFLDQLLDLKILCSKLFLSQIVVRSTSSDHLIISHLRNSLHKKEGQGAVWQNFLQRVTSKKCQVCPLFVNSAQIHDGMTSEKWKLLLNRALWWPNYWYHWKAN